MTLNKSPQTLWTEMEGHTMGDSCEIDPAPKASLSRAVLYSVHYMIHYVGLAQAFHIHSYLQKKPRASP